jgi:diaminopimelate decarboxylase
VNDFTYVGARLHAEGVAIKDIAAEVGTPFYCYSVAAMDCNYEAFTRAFDGLPATICYSVKANSNLAVLREMAVRGAGADVVSGGELSRALKAGMAPGKIVFSGVGKTAGEIDAALEAGIFQINVESESELIMVNERARSHGVNAAVALRVNPDVDADTHEKISTGKVEDKFGVDLPHAPDLYTRAASMESVTPVGLAVHIGSQLTRLDPFREAFSRVAALVGSLRESGLEVVRLDLGGGLGIVYDGETPPDINDYAALIREVIAPLDCGLLFEPGRYMVGNAGILVTRVIRIKEGQGRCFVVVDAGMNDLLRPALYDARHRILPLSEAVPDAEESLVDIVGPVCETGDCFAEARPLPPLAEGDLLAICSAGAYGAVMASTYNNRPLIPEVMVRGDSHAVVRVRQEAETLFALERTPGWQETGSNADPNIRNTA